MTRFTKLESAGRGENMAFRRVGQEFAVAGDDAVAVETGGGRDDSLAKSTECLGQ